VNEWSSNGGDFFISLGFKIKTKSNQTKSLKSMEPIETCVERPDAMLKEIWKAEHIFRDLGRPYTFSVIQASRLPMLTCSPRGSVGFFASEFHITPKMQSTYDRLKPRLLAMQPEPSGPLLSLEECGCIETMAHHLRRTALLESSQAIRKDLFHTAYILYRSFLFACSYPPLTAIVKDLPSMVKKPTLITPIPKLHTIPAELRRRVAHCFGGMALCALMGYQNPVLCYGIASAAVGWEPSRPLELINPVRVNVLMVGKYRLGLTNLGNSRGLEFATDSLETLDALMGMDGSSMMHLPDVYGMLNKDLVLSAVLRFGTVAMLDREREIIGVEEWEKVICFGFLSCEPNFIRNKLITTYTGPEIRDLHQPAHRGPQHGAHPGVDQAHARSGGGRPVCGAPVWPVWRVAERYGAEAGAVQRV